MPASTTQRRTLRDPAEMKALTHPTRLALLEALGTYGPMTATEAAGHVGESPSSCSYHLRQLARYGYVTETGGGTGRRRPWRTTASGLRLDEQTAPDSKIAADALTALYLDRYLARMRAAFTARDAQPPRWRRATSFTESIAWMTPAETRAMNADILAILIRHNDRRSDASLRPTTARPVEVLAFSYPLTDVATDDA